MKKKSKKITIEKLAGMTQDGFYELETKMNKRFDGVDKRFDGVDKRFDGVDKEIKGIKGEMSVMKYDISGLKFDVAEIRHDIKRIDDRTEQTFNLLDKYVKAQEGFKQEFEVVKHQVQKIDKIEKVIEDKLGVKIE